MRHFIDIINEHFLLLELNRAKPKSLIGFIVSHGGVKDVGGNLKSMGFGRFPGLINNRSGQPLDRMREKAAEQGYLGPDTDRAVWDTDINDFLAAIEAHPRYSVFDQERIVAAHHDVSRSDVRAFHIAAEQIIALHGTETEMDASALDAAAWMVVRDGVPVEHAYEDALAQMAPQPHHEPMPDLDGIDFF